MQSPGLARCHHSRRGVAPSGLPLAPSALAHVSRAPGCTAVRCLSAALETITVGKSTNIRSHQSTVSRSEKELLLGQQGCVIWFTGLSASGKSTVACALEHVLHERGHLTMLLDGDNVRQGLNSNLGFSAADRAENIRRISEVAKLAAEAGIITLTAFISPYRADRDQVRERLAPGDFIEVFMSTPLELCEARDPKGLYAKARAGQIKNFTGVDDAYEAPLNAEVVVKPYATDGSISDPYDMADQILRFLDQRGYLSDPHLRTIRASNAIAFKHRETAAEMSAML